MVTTLILSGWRQHNYPRHQKPSDDTLSRWIKIYSISIRRCMLSKIFAILFPVQYTVPPPETTYAWTTESTTHNTDLRTTSEPETTASGQQPCCSLVSATTSFKSCHLPTTTDTSSSLAREVTSAILDDDLNTCMRPFQSYLQLRLVIDALGNKNTALLYIQVTGEGLDCFQPSTLVYIEAAVSRERAVVSHKVDKQECPFIASNYSADPILVTCTYECRLLNLCGGSVRFGVQLQRLNWLDRSQHLKRLCDIRASILIWTSRHLKIKANFTTITLMDLVLFPSSFLTHTCLTSSVGDPVPVKHL